MSQPIGPNTAARRRRDDRQRRAVVGAIVAALLVATFLLVTEQSGFPGPGPLRRYPTRDLQALADRINGSACSDVRGVPRTPVASVDRVRSRVHLSGSSGVMVTPADRPLVEHPSAVVLTTGDVTRVQCVGMTLAG